MSLLIGFSFALFYSILGLPFGRLADSMNRPRLIVAGMLTWSLMTGGCGLARSYWQLFFLRMGVGVGEASLSPAAYSIISDSFPPAKRPLAFSIYTMATYVGGGCAFLFGALLIRAIGGRETVPVWFVGSLRPWEVLFLILGASGVLFALVLMTLRDPARKEARVLEAARAEARMESIPLRSVVNFLLQSKTTFFCLNVGMGLAALAAYGSTAWEVTFLTRTHQFTASQAGLLYGGAQIVSGTLGMLIAGKTVSWLANRGHRDAYMRVAVFAVAAWLLPGILFPLVPSATLSVTLIYVAIFFRCMPVFVIAAAIVELVPNAMRGQAMALYLLVVNLIGLGIGPTAIALVTDRVFGYDAALRYSLAIVPALGYLSAGALFWVGLRSYTASLERLQIWLKQNL